ncbi:MULTISPECIES: alkaline phosphatase family protein [Komagataeibacter]|uniref:Phospholipase n=3 Tax=Komagataeibacter TaxID=1434011 RepID=A0A318QSN0_9PROT|nr:MULTISPECIES: alkaline phosphatase family protein [Komagataeibacter]EGG78500.1 Phospholipase C 3 [Gluconacetobacter sp. SXCC-1]ARW18463.1 Phospholipase C [Komagataeibacter europaeus]MBV0889496.1 phospholipase [Komagataeibacter oboediens]MBV1831475.1 phospholipase [Komagataeibacter melomenusus]MCK9821703.1 phospholipase [Komagataeibacter oboediens]
MGIEHVVVLMLENRSFDSMFGQSPSSTDPIDRLTGTETNPWHHPDGSVESIAVWTTDGTDRQVVRIPDPDPGESFKDIYEQIHGRQEKGSLASKLPDMSGFVDNYMAQPDRPGSRSPESVMHFFTPDQLPVLTTLGREFGISDRWHASAPCQTWPNRIFAHTGTSGGWVNNYPDKLPFEMPTVFNRLREVHKDWKIYFHDFAQSTTLSSLWEFSLSNFKYFEEFENDARKGTLPAYSFIEPRYFAHPILRKMPNDQHPAHDVVYGEELIASVYNAVRNGPLWDKTLLIITYDEHGGCYDHVTPPAAVSPDDKHQDGFNFDYFGVRVPAIIISPYVKPGHVFRPQGNTPYDHTTIIATLRKLFGIRSLTKRDQAAPDFLDELLKTPDNQGPSSVQASTSYSMRDSIDAVKEPLNSLQISLAQAARQLPTAGADLALHNKRVAAMTTAQTYPSTVGEASLEIQAHMNAFTGRNA